MIITLKNNNMKTFEQFLQDKFIDEGEYGGVPIIKDNCEDLFERWLENLDTDQWIELGDEFANLKLV